MYEVIFIGGESHGENISLNSLPLTVDKNGEKYSLFGLTDPNYDKPYKIYCTKYSIAERYIPQIVKVEFIGGHWDREFELRILGCIPTRVNRTREVLDNLITNSYELVTQFSDGKTVHAYASEDVPEVFLNERMQALLKGD
ncbi:TPA: hypothetical protein P0E29_003886 [Vibrio harveyi]|nr:hypothetical protein [Vibrio harveyi]